MAEPKLVSPPPPQDIEVRVQATGLEDALAVVDSREALFRRVAEVAIKATHPSQWTDLGGKPWPTGPAAETIARRFAVSMMNIRRERFPLSDEHGAYVLWVYTATFALPGGRDVLDAEGTCSSRDSFLGADAQEDAYDEGTIMKAALTNCRINGVMQILGLRGMPWDRLEALGIARSAVPKVEYQKGGRGGGSKAQTPHAERELPFGRAKGKKLSEAEESDLKWLRERMVASVADPEKAKYKADNEAWVKAIDEEVARRANAKTGTAAPASGGPSLWERIRALDKTVPEAELKELVKAATKKANARDLVEADVALVADALKKRAESMNSDIPF